MVTFFLVTNFSIAILMLDRTLAVFNFLNKKITLLIYLAIIMRIECIDEDGVSGNPIKVIEELQSSASEASQNTTPEEKAKQIIPNLVTELPKTREVKVRYHFDETAATSEAGDDDFLPGNNIKKRRTGSRNAKENCQILEVIGHPGSSESIVRILIAAVCRQR